MAAVLLVTIEFTLDEEEGLVDGHKASQVQCMVASCFVDDFESVQPAGEVKLGSNKSPVLVLDSARLPSSTKQNRHKEGMGEPNLYTVYKAVSCSFEYAQIVMIPWVLNYLVESLH